MSDETRRLTDRQVEEIYGIPRRQLQQLRYLKRGPAYERLGRAIRYVRADVEAWLKKGRVEMVA